MFPASTGMRRFPRWGRMLLVPVLLAMISACHGQNPAARNGQAAVTRACESIRFEGSPFTICHAERGRHRIRLVDRNADGVPMRDFPALESRLGSDWPRIAFAMNAGMFDRSGAPIGLYVEEGEETKPLNRREGPGNFHLLPNGVFWGDAKGWHVTETEDFVRDRPDFPGFATQSGPMLVIDGKLHPEFADNGVSQLVRNGVGVDKHGDAWFAISDAPVSFGRFARLFRDRLHCDNALFLDGAVSRLWDPPGGRRQVGVPIGPIVVVTQKE